MESGVKVIMYACANKEKREAGYTNALVENQTLNGLIGGASLKAPDFSRVVNYDK